ncbi:MAG: PD-(D/E)XK nuclease family protein, partial [Clostridia bacterium]|nr:PD-(D/E)XK nuclease family protein [Clostridia bacterium]
ALPGGSARQANLNALLSRARSFEQGGSRSLSGFLHFMEKVRSTADFGAAPTGGMDVVRILSIHKSKGLEFPVVFLAGLGKRFNIQDKSASLALDDELGLGLRVRQERRKVDTLFRQQISRRQWRRQLAEEMRLLYVGTTRAQHRLILIGSTPHLDTKVEKYQHPMRPAQLASATCMLDWILYVLMQTVDGNPLRELFHLPMRGGEPRAEVRIHYSSGGVVAGGITKQDYLDWAIRTLQEEHDPGWDLDWKYPYLEAANTPSKASPTAGSGRRRSEIRPLPAFLSPEEGMNAAGRGTAAHLLLQHIPFLPHTVQSVGACIDSLTARGIMTQEQAAVINRKRIAAFFDSDLGKRLVAAKRAERELQFNLQLPASRLGCGPEEESVMIQGIIDCCFLTDEGWVLLDYKTDRIPEGSTAEETAEKHRHQVELYAEALRHLSGYDVAEMHVFLLTYGIDVPLAMREQSRVK